MKQAHYKNAMILIGAVGYVILDAPILRIGGALGSVILDAPSLRSWRKGFGHTLKSPTKITVSITTTTYY
tara:strand:- start:242 stop:451 length:210 start_codon:yes stop_codon:yes gene_type:complete